MTAWLKRRPWRNALGWLALLAPFFYLTYGWANHMASAAHARSPVPVIVFDWERGIPFWQWTIFPYWSINAFYGLSLFLARDRHELRRHGLRLLTAQLVAVSCFVLWPLRFSFGQPEADGAAGLLFAGLRGFDLSFNQAPSLHIALAVILWDFYRQQVRPPAARLFMHVWTFLVCASVLTTYQHHFIDIPTGALLGTVCVWLWPLERQASLPRAWRLTRAVGRLKIAAWYAASAGLCTALALWWGGTALWLLWPALSLLVVALNYYGFGPRGFRMDSRGRMHWSARWLLGPYRAGAWVNARLWTRNVPLASQILPDLWLGRLPDTAEWLAAGKPLVVSLCAEMQNPDREHGRCMAVLDLVPPDAGKLKRAALLINAATSRGHDVWVCCALGFSRSTLALAHALVTSGSAPNHAAAVQLIREKRPQIVIKDPA